MRRPSPAILGSLALHAGVISLAFVTFSHRTEEEKPLVASVPVTIVSQEVVQAAPADNPQPEPSPDDAATAPVQQPDPVPPTPEPTPPQPTPPQPRCLLYTSDAADEYSAFAVGSVDDLLSVME